MYEAGVSPAWTLETIIIYFFLSNLGGRVIFLSGNRKGKSNLSSNIKLLFEIELIVSNSIILFSTLYVNSSLLKYIVSFYYIYYSISLIKLKLNS